MSDVKVIRSKKDFEDFLNWRSKHHEVISYVIKELHKGNAFALRHLDEDIFGDSRRDRDTFRLNAYLLRNVERSSGESGMVHAAMATVDGFYLFRPYLTEEEWATTRNEIEGHDSWEDGMRYNPIQLASCARNHPDRRSELEAMVILAQDKILLDRIEGKIAVPYQLRNQPLTRKLVWPSDKTNNVIDDDYMEEYLPETRSLEFRTKYGSSLDYALEEMKEDIPLGAMISIETILTQKARENFTTREEVRESGDVVRERERLNQEFIHAISNEYQRINLQVIQKAA